MRIKHRLPLSPLSLGSKGSETAGDGTGDEGVSVKCGGEGVAVALLLQGLAMCVPWELSSGEKIHQTLPGLGFSPRHLKKPPPQSPRGYGDISCGEHPLRKRIVLFT